MPSLSQGEGRVEAGGQIQGPEQSRGAVSGLAPWDKLQEQDPPREVTIACSLVCELPTPTKCLSSTETERGDLSWEKNNVKGWAQDKAGAFQPDVSAAEDRHFHIPGFF